MGLNRYLGLETTKVIPMDEVEPLSRADDYWSFIWIRLNRYLGWIVELYMDEVEQEVLRAGDYWSCTWVRYLELEITIEM